MKAGSETENCNPQEKYFQLNRYRRLPGLRPTLVKRPSSSRSPLWMCGTVRQWTYSDG